MRETKDLILKTADPEDWYEMYINLWCHDESARYMLWKPTHSEEEAKKRMLKGIEYQKKNPMAYFVYEKKSGMAIGFAGMVKLEEHVYKDSGIAVGPAFVRKGYGRQILRELVCQAFEELGAVKFVASCRGQNDASRQLQLSCGFIYSHSEDREDPRTGDNYELEFYEIHKQKEEPIHCRP